MIFRESTF
jgi:hypothetical protein